MKKYQSGDKLSKDHPSIGLKKATERELLRKMEAQKAVRAPGKGINKSPAMIQLKPAPLPGKKGDKPKPVPLPGKKGEKLEFVPYKSGGTIKPTTMKKQKTAPKKKMSAKEMEAMKKGKAPMMKYGGKMKNKSC